VDGNGNVYVGDTSNNAVKEVIGGTATKIGSGFSGPRGVAVDGSGNVYVADSSHNAIKEIMAVGGAVPTTGATVTTLGSGFSLPGGVAVDGSGNVYIADTTHSLVKEINVENAPSLSFSSTAVGASSAQQVVTLGNNGNTPLTLDSFSTTANFNLGGAGTTCSNSSTIAAGGSCGLGVVFEPTTVSSLLTGSMPLVDNTLNASSTMQTVVLSGASTLGSKAITFPQPLTPAVMGGSATLTATASNGDPVTYTVVSGTATIAGSAITYTAAGTVTIAADSAATSTYAAATEVTATVTVSADSLTWLPSMLSIYAGAAIGADVFDASSNEPGTITYTSTLLPSGAPVAATAATVLTAGSYDLTATVAPTLPSYQSLQSTQVFTVQNMNAFVANSSGSMASLFNNGTEQSGAISGGGIGAAVDSEGFVWSIGVDGSSLWKFADTGALAATYTGVGLSGATALAIDGNSNLVVTNGNSVVVLSNAGVPLSTTTDSTISGPTGVAVDDAGNVWVSNGANSTVDEVIGGAGPLAPLAVSVQTGNPGAKP